MVDTSDSSPFVEYPLRLRENFNVAFLFITHDLGIARYLWCEWEHGRDVSRADRERANPRPGSRVRTTRGLRVR